MTTVVEVGRGEGAGEGRGRRGTERPGEGEAAAAVSPLSEGSGSKSIWSVPSQLLCAFPLSLRPGPFDPNIISRPGLGRMFRKPVRKSECIRFSGICQFSTENLLFGAWRYSRGPRSSSLDVLRAD